MIECVQTIAPSGHSVGPPVSEVRWARPRSSTRRWHRDAGGDDDLWLPPPQPGAAAMSPAVSQPEVQHQVRQQRADIDALYELVERVDQKVDALDVKLDRRLDETSGQLSEVLRQLGGR